MSRSITLTMAGLLTAISLVAGIAASAHIDASPEAKALAKLDEDWSAAAGTRDAKRVASFYADDAIVYPPGSTMVAGRVAAEKVWAGVFADPGYKLAWKPAHAEVVGALGYTSGTYEDSAGKGKYLCVWKKQKDGSWKAIHDMWNADSK